MGYSNWNEKDGVISEWNEAMFKMRRLDDIQNAINLAKQDPLARNLATGQWNYEVWFNQTVILFGEGESKYKPEEKEICKQLRNLINFHLERNPPYTLKVLNTLSETSQRFILNDKNWKRLKLLLELFESEVKLYNDKHGLSTLNKEDYSGRSILR